MSALNKHPYVYFNFRNKVSFEISKTFIMMMMMMMIMHVRALSSSLSWRFGIFNNNRPFIIIRLVSSNDSVNNNDDKKDVIGRTTGRALKLVTWRQTNLCSPSRAVVATRVARTSASFFENWFLSRSFIVELKNIYTFSSSITSFCLRLKQLVVPACNCLFH